MDGENTSPHAEALNLLLQVIQDMTNPPFDLKANLRRCQHVCELLGWHARRDWFHQELNGYYQATPLPAYRRIKGSRQWVPSGSTYDTIKWSSEEAVYGVDQALYESEPDTLEVRAGVDWYLASRVHGYSEELPSKKTVPFPSGRKTATLVRKRVFQAGAVAQSLNEIEKQVFDFASTTYAQLRFGDIIGDIWERYRATIDQSMTHLGIAGHLSAIEKGLLSDNPEEWRGAAFECRNLLNDVANYLWQDTRPRYEHLKGATDEGTLDVTQGKFGNRIAAYLHQKGITGTRGRFVREEASRLAISILALIPYQSEAHEPISLEDAQSISISTYILLGELSRRTDAAPIREYSDPGDADDQLVAI